MAIVFSKGGMSDLTLERGRAIPYRVSDAKKNQERYLTENQNAIVVDYGGQLDLMRLNFDHLSNDNYDGAVNGLKTWFENSIINYSENNFTMTDENAVVHTVRLWQDTLFFTRGGGDRHSINIVLLKEA